jgi:uncharacterized protein
MEEILASIRRIISEDDPPAEAAAAPEPEPEPEAAAEPEPPLLADEPEDDVLELTERVETHGDLDVYAPAGAFDAEPEPLSVSDAEAEAESPFEADLDLPPVDPDAALVGDPAAAAAAAAFGRLSSSILMPADGRTLEDVVRELLRPLLKQWLDDNLPGIVQSTVEAEVARIARGRVR